jgi:hypothetical protein
VNIRRPDFFLMFAIGTCLRAAFLLTKPQRDNNGITTLFVCEHRLFQLHFDRPERRLSWQSLNLTPGVGRSGQGILTLNSMLRK